MLASLEAGTGPEPMAQKAEQLESGVRRSRLDLGSAAVEQAHCDSSQGR